MILREACRLQALLTWMMCNVRGQMLMSMCAMTHLVLAWSRMVCCYCRCPPGLSSSILWIASQLMSAPKEKCCPGPGSCLEARSCIGTMITT